jgi:hypothetical protein
MSRSPGATEWRERALAGAATALKKRERDDRDDEIQLDDLQGITERKGIAERNLARQIVVAPGDTGIHASGPSMVVNVSVPDQDKMIAPLTRQAIGW